MNKKKGIFLLGLGMLVGLWSYVKAGSSPYAYTQDFYVLPVSQADGDTFSTSEVTVSTGGVGGITLISAAEPLTSFTQYAGTISFTVNGDMNRSFRKRTLHNECTFSVYIGTNTSTLTTNGYDITGGSTTATSVYTTYNKGAIYGTAASSAGSGGCVVAVITETNSVP